MKTGCFDFLCRFFGMGIVGICGIDRKMIDSIIFIMGSNPKNFKN